MLVRVSLCFVAVVVLVLSQSGLPTLPYDPDPDWPRLPEGRYFAEVSAVTTDADGNVYVFHRGRDPIMVFNNDGAFLRSWGEGIFGSAHGLRADQEGNLWAADVGAHTVVKMDRNNGRIRMVLGRRGEPGETDYQFNRPTDIAIAPNGDFYVSDGYGNSRVVKFSKEGKFLLSWGRRGVGEGEFNLPHAIALDKEGRVYVADRENFRIQIFDSDGKFLKQWTHVGSPFGFEITDDGFLFMADGYNDRVLKLDLDGRIVGAIGKHGRTPGTFDVAHHLAVGPAGDLYVAEIVTWRVQRFVPR